MTIRYRSSLYEIADAMERYGGGFVKQLGRLLLTADESNRHKLYECFPEYMQQYDEMAVEYRRLHELRMR